MQRNTGFELIEVAGEYMVVPVDDRAGLTHGIVVLSEPAAYLYKNMVGYFDSETLESQLTSKYDVESSIARMDIQAMLSSFEELGLITQ